MLYTDLYNDSAWRGSESRFDYGMVGLDRGLASDTAAPSGGTARSRLGREGGHEGMLGFMETQYISAAW